MDWSLFLVHIIMPRLFFSTALTGISHAYSTFFLFQASLSVYFTPSPPLLFTCFFCLFVCFVSPPFLFSFSVTSILRWGRRNKNNNRFPYSFHFSDQRWLSNRGGEFRAAFDAHYWCWLRMKISLCYIWANYQRSTQLTWDAPAPCEAM